MEVKRPALRYHGGKWQIRKWVLGHFPRHRVYTDAYGGAASILLSKPRAYLEVYNDVDAEIVNVFRVLRDPVTAARLCELVTLTPYARDEFRAAYEDTEHPVELARRTVIRSQMGFGSDSTNINRKTGFRCSRSSSGTAPALDFARWPSCIASYTARMRGVLIENMDARKICLQHDGPDTLHYLDPTYVLSTRREKRGYRHEMTDGDHVALADTARKLTGMVVISGYRCELYESLYGDWRRVDKDVIVFRAKRAVESLWLNPACVEALKSDGRFRHGRRRLDDLSKPKRLSRKARRAALVHA